MYYFSHYTPLVYHCGLESYVQIKTDRANVYQRGPRLIKISSGIGIYVSIQNSAP